ncbi:MAG: DUF222 domain-containing protein [Actinophytocola sp.]|nr:DUF222 domain-containing protein [Actinophytocola sp.]
MGDTTTSFPVPPDTDWSRVDRSVLVESLRELELLIRRAQAAQGAILAEVQSRGPHPTFGYSSVEAWLKDVVQCSRANGRQRVRRALACNDHTEGTQRLPASAPATGEAFARGEINTAHVDSILQTLSEMPGAVPDEDRTVYEKILVELAAEPASPMSVTKAGRHLLRRLEQEYLDPDPPVPSRPERELHWSWSVDGRLHFTGILDAVSGAQLEKLLSPLAKPRPGENGERDARTASQRNGDALAELLDHAQRAAKLPTEAGERTALMVTMSLHDLYGDSSSNGCDCGTAGPTGFGFSGTSATGDGTAESGPHAGHGGNATGDVTGTGAAEPGGSVYDRVRAVVDRQLPLLNGDIPISVEEARLLACDARIMPAVLGSRGEVLDLGREQRLANTAQRRALALRDKGCVFPSCTRPANWTEAHHIRGWIDLGPTDLDNLALLCGMHHRLIHTSDWTIRMAADGKPECIPPKWIDRHQRPRRNRTFDPYPADNAA